MGKLINVDELREAFRHDIMGGLNWDRILKEAKPVDAVPVVRCKDCYQYKPGWCYLHEINMHDDDFCSRGKSW